MASLRQVKTRISVLVVDVPSEPRNVRIAEHTPNSALLEWEPPDDNGGVELIGKVRSHKCSPNNNYRGGLNMFAILVMMGTRHACNIVHIGE